MEFLRIKLTLLIAKVILTPRSGFILSDINENPRLSRMRKKGILLVSPYNEKKVGGIGTWSINVLNYAKRNDLDLVFLNTAVTFKPNIVKNKFTRIFYGLVDSFLILMKLVIFIIIKRPAVIHYTSSASIALYKDYLAVRISRLFGTEFVIHFRFGRIPELSSQLNSEWKMLIKIVRLSSKCILIDKKSFDILKGAGFENLYYIPNMISSELAEIAKLNQGRYKEIVRGKIVFVGHVMADKGIFELVEACKSHDEIKELHIIGPFAEEVKFKLMRIASSRSLGEWIKFHGEINREEVISIIKDSSLLCLPSYTEGFPNAVLEAMACGCAVVASDVGAISEMLDIGSKAPAGICIEAREIRQLEEAVLKVVTNIDYARCLGNNGLNRVLNDYSPEKVMPQLIKVWNLQNV